MKHIITPTATSDAEKTLYRVEIRTWFYGIHCLLAIPVFNPPIIFPPLKLSRI